MVVASDNRDLWFESSHWPFLSGIKCNQNKEKEAESGPFFKDDVYFLNFFCLLAKKHFENLEKNFSTIKYSSLRPARGVVCKSLRGILVSMAA